MWLCRVFNKPFHRFINLHFATNNKTKAWRKVLQFSSFVWLSQVVFVGLFCFNHHYYCLFSILWSPSYGFFWEAKSDEAIQLNTQWATSIWNHHPGPFVVPSILQRTQVWCYKASMNYNSVLTIAITIHLRERERERAFNTSYLLTLLNRGNFPYYVAAQITGLCAGTAFSHLIWTHFSNKRSTWRCGIPDFSRIERKEGKKKSPTNPTNKKNTIQSQPVHLTV